MSASRFTGVALLGRHLRANLAPLFALAAVVLIISTAATAIPLALGSMSAAEVRYQVDELPSARRDLHARLPHAPAFDGAQPFQEFERSIAALRDRTPAPLADALDDASFISTSWSPISVSDPDAKPLDPFVYLRLGVSTGLADRIDIVEGSSPHARMHADEPLEILFAAATAERMLWEVGEERTIALWPGSTVRTPVHLAGTFVATDASDPYWALDATAQTPAISFTGDGEPIVTGLAFMNPQSWLQLRETALLDMATTVGFPMAIGAIPDDQLSLLLPQLRGFLSTTHPLPGTLATLLFSSDSDDALTEGLQRSSTAAVVAAMVVSAPIGVALAVMWLLVRLIVQRRRGALALISARGAALWQLRLAAAVESLLVSLPAAAAGALIAWLLMPGAWTAPVALVPALLALAPPVLSAIATSPGSLRQTRTDVNPRTLGTARWVFEVLVLATAALALALLLQRGLTTSASIVGVDPLLAATPFLLALTAGLVVLRLYPLPVAAFNRLAKRRAGVVGFVGSARSIRDPSAGLAPVLAMVAALTVTVFSGVLVGTLDAGTTSAASARVGADLRLETAGLTAEQLTPLLETDGVAAGAAVYRHPNLRRLVVDGESINVPVLLADTTALARVQRDVDAAPDYTGLDSPHDGAVPVMLSTALAERLGGDVTEAELGNRPVTVTSDASGSTALSTEQLWVLVDLRHADEFDLTGFRPRVVLLQLDDDVDRTQLHVAVTDFTGANTRLATVDDEVERMRASPIAAGLPTLLIALIGIVALLSAATVVLALLITSASRERLLALLRTLGLTPKQARGITAWEVAPTAVVAVIAGSAVGLALPFVVLAGVDLRLFTGGTLQPGISIDWAFLLVTFTAFAAIVVGATAVAVSVAKRVNLIRTLRSSDEG